MEVKGKNYKVLQHARTPSFSTHCSSSCVTSVLCAARISSVKSFKKKKKKKNDNKFPNLAPSFRVQREEEAVRFDRSLQ